DQFRGAESAAPAWHHDVEILSTAASCHAGRILLRRPPTPEQLRAPLTLMSLRKFCRSTLPAAPTDGTANPLHCPSSPNCDHHWFYDFRVNRRRYRATTETANKQDAKKIEAKERSRILDGRHGIRHQPDISFRTFATTYLDDYAEQHKRSVD